MKFLHKIVILFLHCCRLTCEMKSHHGLTSWNFKQGWNSPPYNLSLRWSFFVNLISHFRKRLHQRCLNWFCMYLCCVRDNYLSVNFSYTSFFAFLFVVIQGFVFFSFSDFSWNSYTCTTIDSKIVLERLVASFNLFLHNWETFPIGHKIIVIRS